MKPYFEREDISLYLGDSCEILPALETVDHVITDPPYSKYVLSKSRAGSRPLTKTGWVADYSRAVDFGFEGLSVDARNAVVEEIARLTKRWVLVFSDVESCQEWRTDLVNYGLDYVRTGAWIKLNATPQFTGDRPAVGFEAITIAHPKGRKKWNGGGKHGIWKHAVERNRDRKSPRLHPTQKPLSLMVELVEQFTDVGDIILDPFAGSGTTGAAAFVTNRKAILIERDEQFCDVAAKRLDSFTHAAA